MAPEADLSGRLVADRQGCRAWYEGDAFAAVPVSPAVLASRFAGPGGSRACEPPLSADGPCWVDLELDDGALTALLWVDPALDCFAGHFPGHPILPGVVQLHWVAGAAAEFGARYARTRIAGCERLKFKAPVGPGDRLELDLRADGGRVRFAFAGVDGVRTGGVLRYAG